MFKLLLIRQTDATQNTPTSFQPRIVYDSMFTMQFQLKNNE